MRCRSEQVLLRTAELLCHFSLLGTSSLSKLQLLRRCIERPFHVMTVVMMMMMGGHYLRQGLTMELRVA